MKLSNAKAKSVKAQKSDGPSREVYEPGKYRAKLAAVEPGKGPKGALWIWKFNWTEKGMKGQIWDRTSLSDEAEWKLKQYFDAFEVDPKTDTDELVGREVWLRITVGTIQTGERRGDERNEIVEVLPISDDDEEDESDVEDDEEEDEDTEEDDEEEEDDESDDEDVEDDDEEEDEEEEDDPPPPARQSSKSGKAVSGSAARSAETSAGARTRVNASAAASPGSSSKASKSGANRAK